MGLTRAAQPRPLTTLWECTKLLLPASTVPPCTPQHVTCFPITEQRQIVPEYKGGEIEVVPRLHVPEKELKFTGARVVLQMTALGPVVPLWAGGPQRSPRWARLSLGS